MVSIIEDQRVYINLLTYFGHDCRRADRPFPGPGRRANAEATDCFDLDDDGLSLASKGRRLWKELPVSPRDVPELR